MGIMISKNKMQNKYSKKSQRELNTCAPELVFLFTFVLRCYDHTILEGTRSDSKQQDLFKAGRSKKKTGKSKHNIIPSQAVDVSPYPIPKDWGVSDPKELAKFYHFAGYVKACALMLGINIRWGGDWDSDNKFTDQSFDDLAHYELV